MGEFEHAYVQRLLVTLFDSQDREWGVYALPEQRVQTRKTHLRIPDVTILREGAKTRAYPHASAISGHRSPIATDQPMRRTTLKAAESRAFGIEPVWVIDPLGSRGAYKATDADLELVRSREHLVPGTPIRVVPEELFAKLDKQ